MREYLTFEIKTPLSVGGRRWGMVQSTRPYVPGWTLWGLLTRTITEFLCINPRFDAYDSVGKALDDVMWISHAFLGCSPTTESRILFLPFLDEATGSISYRWGTGGNGACECIDVSSQPVRGCTSTALTVSKAAEEDSLHEREAIPPKIKVNGRLRQLYLVAHLEQVKESGGHSDVKIHWKDGHSWVTHNGHSFAIREILQRNPLRIGRSGGVGLGVVAFTDEQRLLPEASHLYHHLILMGRTGAVSLTNDSMAFRGELEPLVMRRWNKERGPGKDLLYRGLALAPGSKVRPESIRWVHGLPHGCLVPEGCPSP